MARFLIVGSGERAKAIVELIERNEHVVEVLDVPRRDSLAQVAIVCWLCERSPESFLERAIDSSLRGFLWEGEGVPAIAERNRIPVAALPAGAAREPQRWLREVAAGIAMLGIPLKDDRLS